MNQNQTLTEFLEDYKEQEGKQVFSLESMLRTRDANKNLIHDKNASKEEYVKDLIVLTKGLDKTTIEEIQKGKDTYEAAILNKQMNTVLSDPEMQKELERQLQERQQEIS